MMLRFLTILTSLVFFACGSNEGSKVSGEMRTKTIKTFMPENDLWQEDGFVDNGMTEAKFNEIIESVRIKLAPIVESHGANLVMEPDWEASEVNAYASQEGNNWIIHLFGGLARRSEITEDGFSAVVLHEGGHHLGGYPFVQDWAANEGQSDLFSMLAGANLVWKNETVNVTEVDPVAKKLCDESSIENKSFCYRQMNAGYSLANLLGKLGNKNISFSTPDKTIVSRTINSHPNAQCRLDTYVAGTLCDVAWKYDVIPQNKTEMAAQSCVYASEDGKYDIRNRPRCWYKP